MKVQSYKHVERRLAGLLQLTTDAATSARMGRVRQRGTAPERLVRRALATLGMRYTTQNRDLPGSPDLANRSRRWAVFVHGCYWHRHSGCHRATTPKRNEVFWLAKFARNVERDHAAKVALDRQGYDVLIIWECETEASAALARRVQKFVAHQVRSRLIGRTGHDRSRQNRIQSGSKNLRIQRTHGCRPRR